MKKSENLISKILSMVEANEPWIGIDTHDTTKLYDRKIFTPRNKSGARSAQRAARPYTYHIRIRYQYLSVC